ncbi:hypothetical protein R1sor_025196 [Riccia sorocarpa]|uniref:Early-responsive to dehydration 4 n=1 Tax=Riccia sorocarpa TaxID=122646 RepID=A0ABD3G8F1_9MARC
MVSTSGFITSLGTSFLIFVLLILIFSFLSRRKSNLPIYYPALLLKGKAPPEPESIGCGIRTPWAWMKEAWHATGEELVEIAGLDAAVYVYFHTIAVKIIFWTSIFCVPILIPIAATDNNNELQAQDPATAANFSSLDNIAMGNVQNKSPRLWAFLIGGYWLSFVTYYILREAYKHVIELRAKDQSHVRAKPEQFTCVVRDIPPTAKEESREAQVDAFFKQVHPETYEKSLIVTGLSKTSKLWAELETAKAKLAHAEAVFEESKSKSKAGPDGVRPQHRTGKFGLYGKKVDSIEFWSEKIKELTPKLVEEQRRTATEEQKGAAIIFFNSRRAAAEAGQERHSPFADRWEVLPAPEPRALVWDNMDVTFYQRLVREKVVYLITFFTVVFYMIPIGLVAAFTTLPNLTKYLPFIKPIVDIGVVKALIEAYLPQLALIVFLALLPKLLLTLSKAEGIISLDHIVRAACGKMYYFVVFNVFLGFTIFGTVFGSADSIKQLKAAGNFSFNSIIELFGASLPPNATYFITFISFKFLAGYGLELSRLVPLIVYHLKKKYLCKTEKEVQEAWAPGPFEYMPNVPNDLLVITLTLSYAVIAPLILPFGLAYYAIGWFVQRNQALKVYVPEYESGGRMWPHIHSRILVGLFVSQITMLGYFSVKKFAYVVLLIPLPFLTLLFANVCHKVYYPSFRYVAIAVASEEVKEVPTLSSVVAAFTPTCLLEGSNDVKDIDKYDDGSFQDAESHLPSKTSSGIASPADGALAIPIASPADGALAHPIVE